LIGITEDHLEQLCLNWFRAGGYSYAYGPDLACDGETPERGDYLQVLLTGRLLTALQKINPHLPLATLEEATLTVTKPESLQIQAHQKTKGLRVSAEARCQPGVPSPCFVL
jgi:type I restriction enzyme R subunit